MSGASLASDGKDVGGHGGGDGGQEQAGPESLDGESNRAPDSPPQENEGEELVPAAHRPSLEVPAHVVAAEAVREQPTVASVAAAGEEERCEEKKRGRGEHGHDDAKDSEANAEDAGSHQRVARTSSHGVFSARGGLLPPVPSLVRTVGVEKRGVEEAARLRLQRLPRAASYPILGVY